MIFLTCETFFMGIASCVGRTSADWNVTLGLTNSIPSARLGIARVNALVLDASIVVWTLIVKRAFANFN